jgi:3-hydroxyacyl-[acyl-carrier-protein] dehydratase
MGDLESALAFLPHGPEFRFITRLTQLEPGQKGAGQYLVPGDEWFLKGHFPGDPLLPGVLLLEGAAQLAGIVAQSDPARAPLPGLKLTALRGIKIYGSARPGELVEYEAAVLNRIENLVQARVSAKVNGQLALEGEVVLSGG